MANGIPEGLEALFYLSQALIRTKASQLRGLPQQWRGFEFFGPENV
jgi:hypothetical protein